MNLDNLPLAGNRQSTPFASARCADHLLQTAANHVGRMAKMQEFACVNARYVTTV